MSGKNKPPAQVIPFIPAGKIRCFVTGNLRKDTPEENVRQRWARSLVDEYGYDKADMAVEFSVKMGTKRKRADIVIFKTGGPRRQDTVAVIVEAKREEVSPKDKAEGVEQLKSYMSACSSCQFGLWVGNERLAFEKADEGEIEDAIDIPRFGDTQSQPPKFHELTPATDLKAALRRCHNYIYANQGIQKAEAFHELQKLIFCKVLDEKEVVDDLRFFVRGEERKSIAGQRRLRDERIASLFGEVKDRYPYIFEPDDRVKLNLKVLAYIVSELQRYSLLNTRTDVKGQAYEELVGANLRGDRGEFFTPRNVCDMAVRMVISLHSNQKIASLKVLDCCCGTGGFLVSVINILREKITGFEQVRGGSEEEIRTRVGDRVKELAERNLFGMDINPFLVSTTQMNLVMHGDGSANVFQGDSLVSPSEWEDEGARQKIKSGVFDIVVTNPPFGGQAHIDDPHVLSRYELPALESKDTRRLMPAEQLFVGRRIEVRQAGRLPRHCPSAKHRKQPRIEVHPEVAAQACAGSWRPSTYPKRPSRKAVASQIQAYSSYSVSRGKKRSWRRPERWMHTRYSWRSPRGSESTSAETTCLFGHPKDSSFLDEDDEPTIDDDLPKVVSAFEEWHGG